jgi:hypothetical protein
MQTQNTHIAGERTRVVEFQNGDGAHCGLGDWYPEKEQALEKAIAQDPMSFDTGWYASKKEIASARIYSSNCETINVEVSVSDDFDTNGMGFASTSKKSLEAIREAIYEAWDEAEKDQKGNRQYMGFSISEDNCWIETYLFNSGGLDTPPGDDYYQWGFQDESNIPQKHRDALETWVKRYVSGRTKTKSFKSGKWTIRPWQD